MLRGCFLYDDLIHETSFLQQQQLEDLKVAQQQQQHRRKQRQRQRQQQQQQSKSRIKIK